MSVRYMLGLAHECLEQPRSHRLWCFPSSLLHIYIPPHSYTVFPISIHCSLPPSTLSLVIRVWETLSCWLFWSPKEAFNPRSTGSRPHQASHPLRASCLPALPSNRHRWVHQPWRDKASGQYRRLMDEVQQRQRGWASMESGEPMCLKGAEGEEGMCRRGARRGRSYRLCWTMVTSSQVKT